MNTLFDLGQAIGQIREAADLLEVRGAKNAALVSLIYETSNNIIETINKIAEEYKNNNQDETEQTEQQSK